MSLVTEGCLLSANKRQRSTSYCSIHQVRYTCYVWNLEIFWRREYRAGLARGRGEGNEDFQRVVCWPIDKCHRRSAHKGRVWWVAPLFGVSWTVNAAPYSFAGGKRYTGTIKELIQATNKEIQRQTGASSHTEPRSLNFSRAQRADNDLKIQASIE